MDDLALLRAAALQGVPSSQIPWPAAGAGVYAPEQQEALCAQLAALQAAHGPPPAASRRGFLKAYAARCGADVSEALVEAQAAAMAAADSQTACCRVYEIGGAAMIALEEHGAALVAQGTTGLRSWLAAVALAELAAAEPQWFDGRRVLELGAGPGLAGLAVARLARPTSLILSDVHPDVLALLRRNVRRAATAAAEEHSSAWRLVDAEGDIIQAQQSNHCTVRVADVPWGNVRALDALLPSVDMLIGSDIVYDVETIPPLVQTLQQFLTAKAGGDTQPSRRAIIASTIRNPDTYAAWRTALDALEPQGITTEVLPWGLDNCPRVFDRSCPVQLLLIRPVAG